MYTTLIQLPREILGLIVNSLKFSDANVFGRVNKQIKQELCQSEFGYYALSPVTINQVFDANNEYTKRSNVIGYFISYLIRDIKELQFLPPYTRQVTFHDTFDQEITSCVKFPTSVTHITFGSNFNQSVDDLCSLSSGSLTHLTFGDHFNKPLRYLHLASLLTHITFGFYFNQPCDKFSLPKSLTHLSFGANFDQPMDDTCIDGTVSLTHLTFGTFFNKPVNCLSLAKSLTHLKFGYYFDQPIENVIFSTQLTCLEFGDRFDQPLGTNLPDNLKFVTFGYNFNKSVDNLPKTITHLSCGEFFLQPIANFNEFHSLTHLTLEVVCDQDMEVIQLPSSLTHLTLKSTFNRSVNKLKLPDSLTHLTFGSRFDRSVDKLQLPNLITHLVFGHDFNQPINNLKLPSSLAYLEFGLNFDQQFDKSKYSCYALSGS